VRPALERRVSTRSALYVGEVDHRRRGAVRDGFRYPLYFAGFDVDELPRLDAELRLFGHNRRGVFSLMDRDYEGARTAGLRAAVVGHLRRARIATDIARIELLTQPRVLGYTFNPVSFFLCFDAGGRLAAAIAEINNTYGGRHAYVMGPHNQVGDHTYRTEKLFYVSPYIHDAAAYEWTFGCRSDQRDIRVSVLDQAGQAFFFARLRGVGHALGDRALAVQLARYPMLPARILSLIHWHALSLRRRGVQHRSPPLGDTVRT
jgi:hypothetical protein